MLPTWPELPYAGWRDTLETLHRYTQIIGKIRLGLTPLVNHWWNVALEVTSRGLSTGAIPYGDGAFTIELDLIGHNVIFSSTWAEPRGLALVPRTVAGFHREVMAILAALGVEASIREQPVEILSEAIPFSEDTHHASYDAQAVTRCFATLRASTNIFELFRARFIGKSSPVQFYWGSFDLAVSRFSGRPAPPRPGADVITREAYSHEVMSVGFWPGDERLPEPAYYAYLAPPPPGLDSAVVRPTEAYFHPALGELILPYEAVRTSPSPHDALLDFCESSYHEASTRAGWDPGLVREVTAPVEPHYPRRGPPRAEA